MRNQNNICCTWNKKDRVQVCYPDCVVLAASDDSAGSCTKHRDRLLVSTLYGACELAADHILTAVTGRLRHAASPRGTWREKLFMWGRGKKNKKQNLILYIFPQLKIKLIQHWCRNISSLTSVLQQTQRFVHLNSEEIQGPVQPSCHNSGKEETLRIKNSRA